MQAEVLTIELNVLAIRIAPNHLTFFIYLFAAEHEMCGWHYICTSTYIRVFRNKGGQKPLIGAALVSLVFTRIESV